MCVLKHFKAKLCDAHNENRVSMMLSRVKDRCHGKARGLTLIERENRSF